MFVTFANPMDCFIAAMLRKFLLCSKNERRANKTGDQSQTWPKRTTAPLQHNRTLCTQVYPMWWCDKNMWTVYIQIHEECVWESWGGRGRGGGGRASNMNSIHIQSQYTHTIIRNVQRQRQVLFCHWLYSGNLTHPACLLFTPLYRAFSPCNEQLMR